MADYYDKKYAFFPDVVWNADPERYAFYLLETTEAKVRARREIVGGPDTIPRSLYGVSEALGDKMTVRSTEDPTINVDGTVGRIYRK